MSREMFDHRRDLGRVVLTITHIVGSFGPGIKQLPGNIGHHPAHGGYDLVPEHRMLIVGQEVTQDRRNRADHRVAMGQFVTQYGFYRSESARLGNILDHARALAQLG
jgi:hypothetical protein